MMSRTDEMKMEYEERLEGFKKAGDSKGCAETLFMMAKLQVSEGNQEEAMLMLMEAYNRFQQLGDVRGHSFAGELLGQLLFVSGNPEDGMRVVRESLEGFKAMGLVEEIEKTEGLLAVMEEHFPSGSE